MLIRAVEPLEGVDAMRARPAPVRSRSRRRAGRAAAGDAGTASPDPRARERPRPRRRRPSASTGRGPGIDLCDPASPLRLETAPTAVETADVVATPRIGIAYAGEPWTSVPVAVRARRPPVGLRPARRADADPPWTRARSRCSSSRSSAPGWPRRPSFPPSRRLAEALEPSADPVIVARGLDETDQARALARGAPGRRDRRPPTTSARRSSARPAAAVSSPRSSSRSPRRSTRPPAWRRSSPTSGGRCCATSAATLHPLPALRSTLARSFDPVGELLDTASPRLGGLRAAVRVAYDRLRRRLDSLVGAELGSALQEPIITLRNGRYVVPVKAEARSRVKGIVHDASGSGQTLFIEPLVAVELGNAWREAQVAEAEEIARILDELSALVAANARAAARDARRAGPVRLLGGQGDARRPRWTAIRAETSDRPEVVAAVGAPSRA